MTDEVRPDWCRGRRILVTGASGFVSANLLPRLVAGQAEVTIMVRQGARAWRLEALDLPVKVVRGDLTRPETVREAVAAARPELVFHLATSRFTRDASERSQALQAGVVGTHALLESCVEFGCERVVYAGSSMEYERSDKALREDSRLAPFTFHGAIKRATLGLVEWFEARHSLPVAMLRPFSVYGPWEGPARLIPRAILAAMSGETLPTTSEEFRRDFVHVDDVVDALFLAAENPAALGQVLNIASGVETSNEQLIQAVEEVMGRPIQRAAGQFAPHDSDTQHWVADITRAQEVLGWAPRFDLRAGLQQTAAWIARRETLYRRESESR